MQNKQDIIFQWVSLFSRDVSLLTSIFGLFIFLFRHSEEQQPHEEFHVWRELRIQKEIQSSLRDKSNTKSDRFSWIDTKGFYQNKKSLQKKKTQQQQV